MPTMLRDQLVPRSIQAGESEPPGVVVDLGAGFGAAGLGAQALAQGAVELVGIGDPALGLARDQVVAVVGAGQGAAARVGTQQPSDDAAWSSTRSPNYADLIAQS